ncbi:MAG: metallophosphoesterase family protein [Acidobacteriota bacterium]|nr:MAG: metallophosphoesterase family protein [Acidobacteriota bacterium]
MRYLLLSDVHSNIPALEKVLAAAGEHGYDRAIVLGDLVGYASDPNETIERLRNLGCETTFIRGNHDRVASGVEGDGQEFQGDAREAALWTREHLSAKNLAFLRSLPKGPLMLSEEIELAHGSPADEDAYLLTQESISEAFAAQRGKICFFGHTHISLVVRLNGRTAEVRMPRGDSSTFQFERENRYLINPGSVGQPRDQNPKAAYALYDPEKREIMFFRIAYDIAEAQRRILEAGLPPAMAERLSYGL